jgi:hypothetical protein
MKKGFAQISKKLFAKSGKSFANENKDVVSKALRIKLFAQVGKKRFAQISEIHPLQSK